MPQNKALARVLYKSFEKGERDKRFISRHPPFILREEMGKKKETAKFMTELKNYRDSGISLYLEGHPSSPKAIVKAHSYADRIAESGTYTYMRDYDENEVGEVKRLSFDLIKKE